MSFVERYGPWALITGASSGLGAEFARQLAARGLNVAIVARRTERLDQLGTEIERDHRVSWRKVVVDLADENCVTPIASALADVEVRLVINNAGIGRIGAFLDQPAADHARMLAINCRAPLLLAHRFGAPMREAGRGGLIFVSSIAGLVATPHFAHYSATKAWNHFLAQGLYPELGTTGIDVLSVCPGPSKTEFFDHGELDPDSWPNAVRRQMSEPADVVATALGRLGRAPFTVTGWSNRLLMGARRLVPERLSPAITDRVMRATTAARQRRSS